MPHALEVTLEICLGYVAFSFLSTGLWGALIYRKDRALQVERLPRERARSARMQF